MKGLAKKLVGGEATDVLRGVRKRKSESESFVHRFVGGGKRNDIPREPAHIPSVATLCTSAVSQRSHVLIQGQRTLGPNNN
jgi:hypothetical protein